MSSYPGGILSFAILSIILIYASMKFTKLLKRTNPNISTFLERGAIPTDEKVNLLEVGTKFAFGIEGYLDRDFKDNTEYVKGLLRLRGNKDGA